MDRIIHILKQLEGWGIALQSKYTGDLYFRTTLHVIALQTLLVAVLIVAFSWVLHYTNQQVVNTVISHMGDRVVSLPSGVSPVLPRSIDEIQNASVQYVFAGMVVLSIIFGTILAFITVRPARNSLSYQKLFISNVAHELRTPLSTVKTSTEVALMDETLSPDIRETLTDTVTQLDRLSEIINNLLSLNQFLRPERMGFGNVDLGPLIDRVLEKLSPLASQYRIDLHSNKSEFRMVWGNETALEQVLTNLVKNAISYTPRDRRGIVTVTVQPDYRGSIVVAVADNGIGIAQKDLFHIFEPFYRADTSRTRRLSLEGSGLGLAIVSEIVRAHKGKIMIQSALGKGTTVTLIIPTGETPEGQALYGANENDVLSEVSVDFSKGM